MEKEELQRLYDKAGSARKVAKLLDLTHSGVLYWLRQHGIEVKNPRQGTPKASPSVAECERWQAMYDDAGSTRELGRRLELDSGTVRYHLKRHGVEVKRAGYKSPKSVRLCGEANSNWSGGTYRHSDGYVMQYAPSHPDAPKCKGYVLQHRLVMEEKLGRLLGSDELVHHVNEVKDDNRPENLELSDRSRHMKHHKDGFPRDALGRFA